MASPIFKKKMKLSDAIINNRIVFKQIAETQANKEYILTISYKTK